MLLTKTIAGTWKVRKQEESPLLLPLPPITDTEHLLSLAGLFA